jgi:hypothetical protein
MQEGEVARDIKGSTVVAEEGQVMLQLTEGEDTAIAVMDPSIANGLAIRLTQAAHNGHFMKALHDHKAGRVRAAAVTGNLDGNPLPKVTLWSLLFGGRK